MRGVIVHATLLALMLIVGYRTWSHEERSAPAVGEVTLWNESDVSAVELVTPEHQLRIERRGQGASAYFWGVDTRKLKKPKPPAESPDPSKPPPPPEMVEETTTHEFPLGAEGEKLMGELAHLHALKGLGALADAQKKDFELTDASKKLVLTTRAGQKTLVLGGRVYGGSDRYVLADGGKGFVLSGQLVAPLENGESGLRLNDIRPFEPKQAMQVEIAAGAKRKTVQRIKVKRPEGEAGEGADIETWGNGQTADTAAANFIDKVEQLHPSGFDAKVDPKSLASVVTLTYRDARGKTLGTFQVLERAKPAAAGAPAAAEYFVVTEKTHVPATVPSFAAERIVPDIATVLP
jgi:hypothetical protein